MERRYGRQSLVVVDATDQPPEVERERRIAEARRVLRRDGLVVVLDSPGPFGGGKGADRG